MLNVIGNELSKSFSIDSLFVDVSCVTFLAREEELEDSGVVTGGDLY